MLQQQIEKLQRCIDQQNETTGRLARLNVAPDLTFTLVAISVVLGEVIDALEDADRAVSIAQQAAELWSRNHNEVRDQRGAAEARADRILDV